MEVVETDVEVGPYGPVQHFESDIILLLSTKILMQELTLARATSEASCESVGNFYSHSSRLRLITLTLEAPQA